MTLWNSEQLQRTCCFSRRANGGKCKGPSCGKCREGTQPFVCGFRGAFYITLPEGNLICSRLFVCAAETGLFTPGPGHVFIYIPKAQNILNHTRPWMVNFGGNLADPCRAKAAQSSLNITLKKWPGGQWASARVRSRGLAPTKLLREHNNK